MCDHYHKSASAELDGRGGVNQPASLWVPPSIDLRRHPPTPSHPTHVEARRAVLVAEHPDMVQPGGAARLCAGEAGIRVAVGALLHADEPGALCDGGIAIAARQVAAGRGGEDGRRGRGDSGGAARGRPHACHAYWGEAARNSHQRTPSRLVPEGHANWPHMPR